ncbi:hypothetical protein DFQ29_001623 [Apophysomyces sp. BC1021]|nr:hypothetical protein DFQ29_001623 [Apophysomyces sp. BC1021]
MAVDALQLQTNWSSINCIIAQEIPLSHICEYIGTHPIHLRPDWRKSLVKEIYIYDLHTGSLRPQTAQERGRQRNKVIAFVRAIDEGTSWQICTGFRQLLTVQENHGDTPFLVPPPTFSAMINPLLLSGDQLSSLSRQAFRLAQLPALNSQPAQYPQATPKAWRRFWNASRHTRYSGEPTTTVCPTVHACTL